jgi:type I restriction enzyme S subunit
MQNLLTGKIHLPKFSGEWECVRLVDMCQIVGGGTPDTENQSYWNGSNVWITPTDLSEQKMYITKSQRYISDLGVKKTIGKLIPENSIILSCRAPVGYCAIVCVPFAFNQGCKAIICKNILNIYLYYSLCNSKHNLEILSNGTTFIELNKRQLEEFNVLLPSLPEQKAIADVLTIADREIELLKKKLEQQKLIKKYLMQQLLTDKIRVKDLGKIRKKESTGKLKRG